MTLIVSVHGTGEGLSLITQSVKAAISFQCGCGTAVGFVSEPCACVPLITVVNSAFGHLTPPLVPNSCAVISSFSGWWHIQAASSTMVAPLSKCTKPAAKSSTEKRFRSHSPHRLGMPLPFANMVRATPETRTGLGKSMSHRQRSSACTPMSMQGPPPDSLASMNPGAGGSQARRIARTRAW